jgi:hypothetical protein
MPLRRYRSHLHGRGVRHGSQGGPQPGLNRLTFDPHPLLNGTWPLSSALKNDLDWGFLF